MEINQYKNKATDKFYAPGDLIVGKDVIINSYSLHIIDCDEFTRKWYLKNMGQNWKHQFIRIYIY